MLSCICSVINAPPQTPLRPSLLRVPQIGRKQAGRSKAATIVQRLHERMQLSKSSDRRPEEVEAGLPQEQVEVPAGDAPPQVASPVSAGLVAEDAKVDRVTAHRIYVSEVV